MSAFWDFSRCPWWYAPAGLFWRTFHRAQCWVRSRHAPISSWSSDYDLWGDGWFHHCDCGYFGHVDERINEAPCRISRDSSS